MKGNISLKEFIKSVKEELLDSLDEKEPFFVLDEVELEAAFTLDVEGKAGAKLVVVDIGGSTSASQVHRVKLKLTPFVEMNEPDNTPPDGKPGNRIANKAVVKKVAAKTAKKAVAKKVIVKRRPTLKARNEK